ncbi:FixH family protein [Lysinibacillus piscis]|uniref:YtkA-like domain-containing protein n=1 Tax=Lysinibacillus piscis TaxID=2518931 RepID=A0ABQ5NNA8_9BACI|nr:FixH family protein [Lysinibacillus sp. KH24]GLC89862.1 hypothetical protein LYSBPC_29890 [Lysinibacillus sp. KH24]
MKKWLVALVAVPALLVGCGEKELKEPKMPEMLEVEILTPQEIVINAKVELAVQVEQGGKDVDNATVEFEVWESGKRDEGQMIEGKLDKDGIYKATTIFDHDGVYYMYAHTTANGIHNMPKQQFTAGNPDMSKVLPEEEDGDDHMMDGEMEHSEHGKKETNHH